MEKTDGEGHGEFKALIQDWQHDVPVARLDPQHDVQSVDKGYHLASSHVSSNVLACLGAGSHFTVTLSATDAPPNATGHLGP